MEVTNNSNNLNKLPYLIGLIAWLICVYPPLILSDWFFFDAPFFVTIGEDYFSKFLQWILPLESGRYIPFFWFYYAVTHILFGTNYYGYFFIQSIIILLSTFLIIYLSKWLTGCTYASIIAILLFYTSSPMAENITTIAKQEHLILFFILLLVFIYIKYLRINQNKYKYIYLLLSAIVTLLAVWTKETAMVLLVLSFTSFAILWLLKTDKKDLKKSLVFYSIISLSVLIARIPYYLLKNPNAGYTSYQVSYQLIIQNFKYYLKNSPDVFFLGFVSITLLLILLVQTLKNKEGYDSIKLSILFGLTVLAWVYLFGLFIWRWPLGYYLFVISAIFCMVIAAVLKNNLLFNRTNRKIFISLLFLIAITRMYTIPYNIYISFSQQATAQLYSEAISNYANIASDGQRLLIEQWAFFGEEISQTNHLVQKIFNKSNLSVDGLADIMNQTMITPEMKKLYGFNDIPESRLRMPKKDDYVLVLTGNRSAYWGLRGVSPFVGNDSILKNMGMDLELISMNEQNKKMVYLNQKLKPSIGNVSSGYKLYKVRNANSAIWSGRFSDGWIGQKAAIEINNSGNLVDARFKLMALDINLPNKIKIINQGEVIKEINITNSNEQLIVVPSDLLKSIPGALKLEFEVEKTFVPRQMKINDDSRELGIQIDYLTN